MFFYTWMIKNPFKDDSAKGLLARRMKAEGNGFPKRRQMLAYLLQINFWLKEYKIEIHA